MSCSQAGGMACVNMGDATRKINSSFQLYPNHVKITEFFLKKDFSVLPDILWRKQTNKANKFMGSGMLPTNAYVTLEHEYILIFRKGKKPRNFKPKSKRRYNSAYFWEERNKWFSDIWFDIKGTLQNLNNNELRDRAAAFPIELPYRLINMYSVQGDTVLDPFWGTGTTSLAAMISARNSVGYELEKDFMKVFDKRVKKVKRINEAVNKGRIQRHLTFQKEREKEGKELSYKASNYNFNVTTKQERKIRFYSIEHLKKEKNIYKAFHHIRDQPVGDTLSEQT
ncbi:MAG: site-specific DNA-methyltransferase [Euryarchaeota archaeon]|nr:site-specific DNA-methyltransferase [Euryarchaeota archaeon]